MVQQRVSSQKKKKSGAAGIRLKSSKKSVSGNSGVAAVLNNGIPKSGQQEGVGKGELYTTSFPHERFHKKDRLKQTRLAKRRGIAVQMPPEVPNESTSTNDATKTSLGRAEHTTQIIAKHLRSLHPSEQRRAALKKRREAREKFGKTGAAMLEGGGCAGYNPLLHNAKERLDAIKADMDLYEQAVQAPLFKEDPLNAIAQHLEATLDVLQPLTPDVGRVPRPISSFRS